MKKLMAGISALLMGVASVHAAFEVTLDELSAGSVSNAVFTYSNLDTTPTFNGGALSVATAVTDSNLTGASGSFTVKWEATDIATPFVGTTWSYGATAPLYSFASGLGIISAGQTAGARMFSAGEAFLLTFVTTDLTLDSGKILVFSAKPQDGKGFNVYQRTGISSGVLVAELDVLTPSAFSPVAIVPLDGNGTNEFAIADFTGGGLMLDFRIDVVDTITGVAKPTGLTGIPVDSGAILSWNPDPTGFLDYYTVYRSEISDTNTYVSITNVVNTTYTDSGLTNGTTYYYAITAVGTSGTPVESEFSDELAIAPVATSTNTVFLMHYDASVASSITASNGLVSSWENRVSPDTYDAASDIAGTIYPSTNLSATGIAGLDFTTNSARLLLMDSAQSDLLLNTTGGKSGFVVLMALRPEGIGTQQDIIGNTSIISEGFGLRWTGTGFQTWLGSGGATTLGSTATNGDTLVVSYRFDVASREASGWESASGNTFTVTRNPGDYSLANNFTLGQTTSNSRNFNGQIFEVKIWGSTLDDATLEAQRSAMVTKWVVAAAGYDAWAGQWGIDIGAPTNDYDSDGLDNLYEYALGGDPTNFTQAPAVLPMLIKTGSGFNYLHVQRNNDPGLTYTVETTTDLVHIPFTNMGYTVSGTNMGAGVFDTVTNAIPTTESELFIKLKIEN